MRAGDMMASQRTRLYQTSNPMVLGVHVCPQISFPFPFPRVPILHCYPLMKLPTQSLIPECLNGLSYNIKCHKHIGKSAA